MATHEYVHPELLVETEWLEEHISDSDIRIVDCDSLDAYLRTHIPGAVSVGKDHYIKDPDFALHVMAPEKIADFFGRMGIGNDTLVIAYEGRNSPCAARLWWVLNYYGHSRVKLLNGGFRTWFAEGRPTTAEVPNVEKREFVPKTDESLIIRGNDLKSVISNNESIIWDVRSEGEYSGETTRGNRNTGHVPGAVHLEWNNMVESDGTGKFKPASVIASLLNAKGISADKQVYTY